MRGLKSAVSILSNGARNDHSLRSMSDPGPIILGMASKEWEAFARHAVLAAVREDLRAGIPVTTCEVWPILSADSTTVMVAVGRTVCTA